VADHRKVKRPLIQAQIRLAGISEADYLDAFHKRMKR